MPVDRVLIDANCLHKLYLRTLLLTLADAELIEPRWSKAIITETIRSITRRFPERPSSVSDRLNSLSKFFKNSLVVGYEYLVGGLGCLDQADEHVLAAAIHSESDVLLTFNLSDFPKETFEKYGVKVMNPDRYLMILANKDKEAFLTATAAWMGHFKMPAFRAQEAVQAIQRAGCGSLSVWLDSNANELNNLL